MSTIPQRTVYTIDADSIIVNSDGSILAIASIDEMELEVKRIIARDVSFEQSLRDQEQQQKKRERS